MAAKMTVQERVAARKQAQTEVPELPLAPSPLPPPWASSPAPPARAPLPTIATEPAQGGKKGRLIAGVLGAFCALGLIGFAIDGDDSEVVSGSAAPVVTVPTTLSPSEQAAADQAVAEEAAAKRDAAEGAAAERAAAEQAAAEMAAAEKVEAERVEAERIAAELEAAKPRTISGTGSKVTSSFTLLEAPYRVSWSAQGERENFIVHIRNAAGGDEGLVNEIHPEPSSGEEFFDSPGGEFFLEVDASELSWTATFTKIE